MIVFPLKFFPWIMIATGIGLLFVGEMIAWAIVLLILGLLWAGFQVSGYVNKRNARQSAPAPRVSYNAPQPQQTEAAAQLIYSQPQQAQTAPQPIYSQPQQVYTQPSAAIYNQYSQHIQSQPQQPSICPNCQNADIEGMIFCGKCGYRLK